MGRTERGARGSVSDAPSIEFLAPRAGLFDLTGERVALDAPVEDRPAAFADVDEEAQGPRWATLGAGLGLLALIAVGVVAAAPWHDDTDSAPTPSSIEPSGSVPGSPTTISMSDGPIPATSNPPVVVEPGTAGDTVLTDGYLLDPVLLAGTWRPLGGLSPDTATDTATDTSNGTSNGTRPNGWLELWATPGASRITGSWFAVQYTPSAQPFARQDAARIELGQGNVGLLTETTDGVSSLSFPVGRATATITWFGWKQPAIVEMAGGIRFARSGRPRYADDGFTASHSQLLARSSFGAGLAQDLFMTDVISSAHYGGEAPDGSIGTIDITTRRADAELDDVLSRFVIGAPVVLGDTTTMFTPIGADTVTSGDVHYPDASAPQDLHVLQWTAGSVTVQLTTTLPTATLFSSFPLGLIGPGSEGAWQRQQYGIGSDSLVQRPTVDLGSGTLPDGAAWQMTIEPARSWVNTFVTSPDRSRGIVVQMDLGFRPCGTAASAETTVILCVRPAGLGAATLRIEGEWGSIEAPFVPIGTGGEWVGVVLQYDQTGGYAASIIGPNGTTTPALALGARGSS